MTFVDAPIFPLLTLRGRAQSMFAIVEADGYGATPVGLLVDVGLSGTLCTTAPPAQLVWLRPRAISTAAAWGAHDPHPSPTRAADAARNAPPQ